MDELVAVLTRQVKSHRYFKTDNLRFCLALGRHWTFLICENHKRYYSVEPGQASASDRPAWVTNITFNLQGANADLRLLNALAKLHAPEQTLIPVSLNSSNTWRRLRGRWKP